MRIAIDGFAGWLAYIPIHAVAPTWEPVFVMLTAAAAGPGGLRSYVISTGKVDKTQWGPAYPFTAVTGFLDSRIGDRVTDASKSWWGELADTLQDLDEATIVEDVMLWFKKRRHLTNVVEISELKARLLSAGSDAVDPRVRKEELFAAIEGEGGKSELKALQKRVAAS